MPFILSKVSTPMNETQEKEIKTRLGQAISLIPGKSEAYLLCGFESNYHLYLRGENDAPIAYVTVSIFANERHIGNGRLFAAITEAFYEVLGISPDRVYIKYDDIAVWGVCGQAIDRRDFQ